MIEKTLSQPDLEAVYDLIADGVDTAGPRAEPFLAKLSLALANLAGDRAAVERAVSASLRDL